MVKEGWQRKWRRLMLETGLFLAWRVDDIQTTVKHDELIGMSAEESVAKCIKQKKEV